MTINVSSKLIPLECNTCAGVFALSEGFVAAHKRENRWEIVCPYCVLRKDFESQRNKKLLLELAELRESRQRLIDSAHQRYLRTEREKRKVRALRKEIAALKAAASNAASGTTQASAAKPKGGNP